MEHRSLHTYLGTKELQVPIVQLRIEIWWTLLCEIVRAYPKIESEWQVFEDAYKSPLSIIILDDIERCVDLKCSRNNLYGTW
jgi:hypothetical protein